MSGDPRPYDTAYSISNLMVCPRNDEENDTWLAAFLFAINEANFRSASSRRRRTIMRKYREVMVAMLERAMKAKRVNREVQEFLKKFPDAMDNLRDEEAPVSKPMFTFLLARVVKKRSLILTFREGAIVDRSLLEEPVPPMVLIDVDASEVSAPIYEPGEPPVYVFEVGHRVSNLILTTTTLPLEDSPTTDEADTTATDTVVETENRNEPVVEVRHVDDLIFEEFEGDLEIDREAPISIANMDQTHLQTDLQQLVPNHPDVASYARLFDTSSKKPPVFPTRWRPIVRVDTYTKEIPIVRDSGRDYRNRRADFKEAQPGKTFVEAPYSQQDELAQGTPLDAHCPNAVNAVLDTFGQEFERPFYMDFPMFYDREENSDLKLEFLEKLTLAELRKHALIYDVPFVKNKSRMCERMRPYVRDIYRGVIKPMPTHQRVMDCMYETIPAPYRAPPVSPMVSARFLCDDSVRTSGLAHAVSKSDSLVVFDMDSYDSVLSEVVAYLPTKCEMRFFNREDRLTLRGTIVELISDSILRVRGEDDVDRFYNVERFEDNYFFLYPDTYGSDAYRYNKHDLARHNIVFRSLALTPEDLHARIGMTVEQFLHLYRLKAFEDTPFHHESVLTAVERVFGLEFSDLTAQDVGKLEITELDFQKTQSKKQTIKQIPTKFTEPVPKFLTRKLLKDVREDATVLERMHEVTRDKRFFSRLVEFIASDSKETANIRAPSDASDPIAPPPLRLQFDSFEEMRAYREELRPFLDQQANAKLRNDALALQFAQQNSEAISVEHAETAIAYEHFARGVPKVSPRALTVEHDETLCVRGEIEDSSQVIFDESDALPFADEIRTNRGTHGQAARILHVPVTKQEAARVQHQTVLLSRILKKMLERKRGTTRPLGNSEETQMEEFATICGESAILTVLVLFRRQMLDRLVPEHAHRFMLDGPPLTPKVPRGVVPYFASVLSSAYGATNPFFKTVANTEATLTFAVGFYANENPSIKEVLSRRATQNQAAIKSQRSPAPYKPYANAPLLKQVETSAIRAAVDPSFVMYPSRTTSNRRRRFCYEATASAVRPSKKRSVSRLEELSKIRLAPITDSKPPEVEADDPDALDEELTKMVDDMEDVFDLRPFLELVLRDVPPRKVTFSVNKELAFLLYESDTALDAKMVRDHLVRSDPLRSHLYNAVACVRTVHGLFRALFQGFRPPIDPDRKAIYDDLVRIVRKGFDRIVTEGQQELVEIDAINKRVELLRERDKQRMLKSYQNMDAEQRNLIKMLKDSVGLELEQNEEEGGGGGADDWREDAGENAEETAD